MSKTVGCMYTFRVKNMPVSPEIKSDDVELFVDNSLSVQICRDLHTNVRKLVREFPGEIGIASIDFFQVSVVVPLGEKQKMEDILDQGNPSKYELLVDSLEVPANYRVKSGPFNRALQH